VEGWSDFEDAQAPMRIAIGEGIESGAEDYKLPDALRHRASKFIFGEAAAGGHEGAKGAGKSMVLLGGGTEGLARLRSDNAESERIVKNFGLIEKLVRGAAEGPHDLAVLLKVPSCMSDLHVQN